MQMKKINKTLGLIVSTFLIAFFVPFSEPRILNGVSEALLMLNEYAKEHVLLCIVPALFIAAAIVVFLNQQTIIKYFGPKAKKGVAYLVASLSGAILAVCSCTILPLFKGIHKKGAGLGPAIAFLYSGPAINILAIILSYKVFGLKLALARMVGAIVFAIVIGLLMQFIFRKEEQKRLLDETMFEQEDENELSLMKNIVFIAAMIGFLIFVNWAPSGEANRIWDFIYKSKYYFTALFVGIIFYALWRWFNKEQMKDWLTATKELAIQIFPLLFSGVLIAGFLLGRPNHEALIPSSWIMKLVGGNSFFATLFASVAGAFMYFATLTEIPIVQSLIGSGMGQGPALALLLAGPSLSLPSMLVIGKELGVKKTAVYVTLVITLSTLTGVLFSFIVA
jgi:uncharacterized membrane protein YraQ (UPF0718 family)